VATDRRLTRELEVEDFSLHIDTDDARQVTPSDRFRLDEDEHAPSASDSSPYGSVATHDEGNLSHLVRQVGGHFLQDRHRISSQHGHESRSD
jgi:hypothetical protein